MRKATLLAILFSASLAVGCNTYKPDAGHEIVLVEKPLIFSHGGVDPEPVKTGLTIAALTTDGVDVSMQPQKFETDLPDTMTSDGVPIEFHAIVVLQVTDSVSLIKNFDQVGTKTISRSRSKPWFDKQSANAV